MNAHAESIIPLATFPAAWARLPAEALPYIVTIKDIILMYSLPKTTPFLLIHHLRKYRYISIVYSCIDRCPTEQGKHNIEFPLSSRPRSPLHFPCAQRQSFKQVKWKKASNLPATTI